MPGHRTLVYGGFFGPFAAVREACQSNNLGHPLHHNIRAGNWLVDYLVSRLTHLDSDSAQPFKAWATHVAELLKAIPRFLVPKFFSAFVFAVCYQAQSVIEERAQPWMSSGPFFRQLSVATHQFVAQLRSAQFDTYTYSMSAGLPHFAVGWTRSWGRDTFIAFKGGLLLPGMHKVAREVILQFASCLRHGLLPNLLDSGRNPRYNCRDACWWFMKALKDYVECTGDTAIWRT